MKNRFIILLCLIGILCLAGSAGAETLLPMASDIRMDRLEYRFLICDVGAAQEDGSVRMTLFVPEVFERSALEGLKAGDVIRINGEDCTVETVSVNDAEAWINQGTASEKELRANEYGEYHLVLINERLPYQQLGTIQVEIPENLAMLDCIDPATGEQLEKPTVHTGEEFLQMLREDPVGFDVKNTWVLFGVSNVPNMIVRYYVSWQ